MQKMAKTQGYSDLVRHLKQGMSNVVGLRNYITSEESSKSPSFDAAADHRPTKTYPFASFSLTLSLHPPLRHFQASFPPNTSTDPATSHISPLKPKSARLLSTPPGNLRDAGVFVMMLL
jgi:hypothetical protein